MKLLLFCILFSIATPFYIKAQTQADIVETLEKKHSWGQAKIVEECVTINAPKELFATVLADKRAADMNTFSYSSSDLGKYFYKVYGADILNSGEKTSSNMTPEQKEACAREVSKISDKLKITLNANGVKLTEDSYERCMTVITTIGQFFNPERGYGVAKGWRPNADKVAIIINAENTTGKPVINWSKDFSACTINLPGAGDTNYSELITDGLKKGGKM